MAPLAAGLSAGVPEQLAEVLTHTQKLAGALAKKAAGSKRSRSKLAQLAASAAETAAEAEVPTAKRKVLDQLFAPQDPFPES